MNSLSQLHDIHLPPPVSSFPSGIGWWIIILLCLSIIIFFIHYLYNKQQQQLFRRLALTELQQIQTQSEYQNNPVLLLKALSDLLRRVAIIISPRTEVAQLTGQAWLRYLDKTGNTQEFTQGVGKVLLSGPYQKQLAESLDKEALIQLIHKWIEDSGKGSGS